MKKSIMTAVLYVAAVMGGFAAYDEWVVEKQQVVAGNMHETNGHGAQTHESSHEHGSDNLHDVQSEVNVSVQAEKEEVVIFLKDKEGNPVTELEINHEKILHLIMVDESLQKYYHVHPEQTGKGEFRVTHSLKEGSYKAFVDIKPKHLAYHVTPVPFQVGNPEVAADHGLSPDSTLTRQVDGETVTLLMSSLQANEPVMLNFELDQTNLTPYLGAMGHVVILDEKAQHFLHVHPSDEKQPIFETKFSQPGIYKIWAEFKQNGKVRAFPFVVEIKGEK
ncbi:hypothetical protein [Brevibacillus panacihumi]|uniref:Secreted protein n=1 Tax=Brevibacillus panacihumi TaxID=497735 RepID=A0A3M8DC03_9BACL|nr:hypothetical protein [Brevibacillus panacihumi]RNB85572.1 hypothetical protein EDM58_03320 [Brevibacillus panacihumi]